MLWCHKQCNQFGGNRKKCCVLLLLHWTVGNDVASESKMTLISEQLLLCCDCEGLILELVAAAGAPSRERKVPTGPRTGAWTAAVDFCLLSKNKKQIADRLEKNQSKSSKPKKVSGGCHTYPLPHLVVKLQTKKLRCSIYLTSISIFRHVVCLLSKNTTRTKNRGSCLLAGHASIDFVCLLAGHAQWLHAYYQHTWNYREIKKPFILDHFRDNSVFAKIPYLLACG